MQKYIHVTMPDSSVWRVRTEAVVVNRTVYYATQEQERGEDYWSTYEKEYEYAHTHDDEVLDWAANNMNWSDVADVAEMVPQPEKSLTSKEFQEGWVNGPKSIVEQ